MPRAAICGYPWPSTAVQVRVKAFLRVVVAVSYNDAAGDAGRRVVLAVVKLIRLFEGMSITRHLPRTSSFSATRQSCFL